MFFLEKTEGIVKFSSSILNIFWIQMWSPLKQIPKKKKEICGDIQVEFGFPLNGKCFYLNSL